MGKIDPTKERERLTKLYAGMSELELLEVGMEPQELTEWARSALLVEIHRRGLEWRPEPTKTETVPEDQILMILGKYDNRQSAMVDRDFLARSGVKAYFLEQESEGTATGFGPRWNRAGCSSTKPSGCRASLSRSRACCR